jgi:simple sugar transport system ATP-binding protein
MAASSSLVELQNVSKRFGGVYALRGVNLQIRPREIVCLLGDNGAGKSTLIKIIMGVHRPDEGSVIVKGKDVTKEWSPRQARRFGIEAVYQDKALADQQTVLQNIFMGRELTTWLGLLDKRRMRAEAETLIRRIGFTSKLLSPESVVARLSGGEREGVAIARAMHFRAELIILDEPTTALSLNQAQQVLEFIRQAQREGAAVLFISHNIYHAYEVGERLVILDRGRINAEIQKEAITVEELIQFMQRVARGTVEHGVLQARGAE